MPATPRTTTAPPTPPPAGAPRPRRWGGLCRRDAGRRYLLCAMLSWPLAWTGPASAQVALRQPDLSQPASSQPALMQPALIRPALIQSAPTQSTPPRHPPRAGPDTGRRAPGPAPRIALDDRSRAPDEPVHCPGLSGRASETERQARRAACLRQAQDDPGQNGPPSQSQRAIQALTRAISTVSGKPMRRKSAKRYWPGPRMRRFP